MKLRLKLSLILAGMWAVIFLMIYGYSTYTLTHDYAKLERNEVIEDIQQTRRTLDSIFSALTLLTRDWSQWDDAYLFMSNKNTSFIKSNLVFTTFENANINLILFFDSAGKLFYGLNYDLAAKHFKAVPHELIQRLELNQFLHSNNAAQPKKMGILKTKEGYVVLSALPILTSQGKGPSRGTIVMGYYFNDRHIEQLSNIIGIRIHLFPLPLSPQNKALNKVYEHLTKTSEYVSIQNAHLMNGFSFIKNIDGNPIGILRIQVPRILYNEGLHTINQYLAILIGTGMLLLIAMWYLLKIFILDRLISVSRQMIDIKSESKFSNRIQISGKDELTEMVNAANSLMEIIELTQNQLKYRIRLRTEELERLSMLNKNLHLEMGHQKEIEEKLRAGEKVLRHLAYYDMLTGLPNRVMLHEMMRKMLMQSKDSGLKTVVIFLDADKFKTINDTFGHDIGDKFLRHIAQLLKLSINDQDIVARLSGDEFIICLPNILNKAQINAAIQNILSTLETPFNAGHIQITSTFSMGISIYPDDGKTVEELERHADLAMYYAKKQPGRIYCYYDELHIEIVEG